MKNIYGALMLSVLVLTPVVFLQAEENNRGPRPPKEFVPKEIRVEEKVSELKDRLNNREFKLIPALENIANRLAERIIKLEERGLNLAEAKTSLAKAKAKIAEVKAEVEKIKNLIEDNKMASSTASTTNQTLRPEIKAAHEKIKALIKEAHALLKETIRNINQVLPKNGLERNASSTNN